MFMHTRFIVGEFRDFQRPRDGVTQLNSLTPLLRILIAFAIAGAYVPLNFILRERLRGI